MSRLRIKPRTKLQRRGERLIVTTGGERLVLVPNPKRTERRVIEASRAGEQLVLTYSPCGRYALQKGNNKEGPVQLVIDGDFFDGERIAIRERDNETWVFADREKKRLYVSLSHTGIRNTALAASTIVARMNSALAEFLGVSPMLCSFDDLDEIHRSHRWNALREFRFEFTPPTEAIGTGRRAENTFRHTQTNYDEMLREGAKDVGGLLYPEQYQRVREGADRIVRSLMK
jgi:hypothetical protein